MALMAENSGGDFENPPTGTHNALCIGVYDMGIHASSNPAFKPSRKVLIAWEIDSRMVNEGENKGKRFVVTNQYTLSLSDQAHLRKMLVGWRGVQFTPEELTGFDIEVLKGIPCLVSLIEVDSNGKTYINVSTVAKKMETMVPITQETNWTVTPNWIRKRQVIGKVEGIIADPEDNVQPAQTGMNEVRNNLTGQQNVTEADAIVNNNVQPTQTVGSQPAF